MTLHIWGLFTCFLYTVYLISGSNKVYYYLDYLIADFAPQATLRILHLLNPHSKQQSFRKIRGIHFHS